MRENPENSISSELTGCVHLFMEAQAAQTPDAVAVEFGGEKLSYAEINARANQIARHLTENGVAAETVVGICVERSVGMLLAVLAVLKAGGAYLPLDPAYPAERLSFMLADAQVPLLLTQPKYEAQFKDTTSRIIFVDSVKTDAPAEDQPAHVSGENAAYVIYTSGSTGRPKGVLMPHAPLANLLQWHLVEFPVARRTLQFAPLSFDVSFQEIFSTWASGGTLVLVEEALRRDPAALWNFIIVEKIERLFLPFVALQQLATAAGPVAAPHLREIITAGEQLRVTPAIADFFGRMKECMLHNHYGPTESHVVTAYTLRGTPESWPALPPIGRPVSNAVIRIAGEGTPDAPAGEAGEILIGGDCLARGYLNRPDVTAEKFIEAGGGRFYKSGDIGRILPGGDIEYLGRVDDQAKVRGYRVEPGEIEAVLGGHPAVKQIAVAVRQDPSGDKVLVAYVVPGGELDMPALRNFAREKLPEYFVPHFFVKMDALPLTPSGKVDRRSLPDHSGFQPADNAAPPRNELEKNIAAAWESVLHVKNIGIHDNFFDAGGDSLRLTSLHAKLVETLKMDVAVTALFEHPTIGAFADFLSRRGAENTDGIADRAKKQRDALARRRQLAKTP